MPGLPDFSGIMSAVCSLVEDCSARSGIVLALKGCAFPSSSPEGRCQEKPDVLAHLLFSPHPVPYANKFATVLSGYKKRMICIIRGFS